MGMGLKSFKCHPNQKRLRCEVNYFDVNYFAENYFHGG